LEEGVGKGRDKSKVIPFFNLGKRRDSLLFSFSLLSL